MDQKNWDVSQNVFCASQKFKMTYVWVNQVSFMGELSIYMWFPLVVKFMIYVLFSVSIFNLKALQ